MLAFRAMVALLLGACSSSLPEPPLIAQPSSEFAEVPYPPPPALAEAVPERPKNCDCVWIEGSWKFRTKSYAWQRGGWFIRPPNALYARPKTQFAPDGRIMYAAGRWYDARGAGLEHVRPVVPALRPKNEYTSEEETAR
jgi:hypothetical protein